MIIFKEKYFPKDIEKEMEEKERQYKGNIAAVESEYISLETREKRLKIVDTFLSSLLTIIFTSIFKFFAIGTNEPFLFTVACSFVGSYFIVKVIQEEEYASLIKNKHILRCIMDKGEKDKKIEQDIELGHADELLKAMSRLCALERSMVKKAEKADKDFDIEDCLSKIMMHLENEYSIKYDAWINLAEDVLLFEPAKKEKESKKLLLERIGIQQKEMKELYGEILKKIKEK